MYIQHMFHHISHAIWWLCQLYVHFFGEIRLFSTSVQVDWDKLSADLWTYDETFDLWNPVKALHLPSGKLT